ncbi:hypothetical protein E4U52_001231, partial [Claviceps spartinae]
MADFTATFWYTPVWFSTLILTQVLSPQEKRYRSMQEHIRRAHPESYIPKLPATEESFLLMINTPPQEHRAEQESRDSRNNYHDGLRNSETPRRSDEYTTTGGRGSTLGVAGAAVALAELHAVECDRDAEKDG